MKLPFLERFIGQQGPGSGTETPIRILLIDDDEDEAVLVRSLLARIPDSAYRMEWVATYADGLMTVLAGRHDAYIVDQHLGGAKGVDLIREARARGVRAPLIMMTGERSRATDLAALQAGASDFLLKGRTDVDLLDRTLRYGIAHAAAIAAVERAYAQLEGLEQLGRTLADEGATTEAMESVLDLMAEQFGFRYSALYLVAGDVLEAVTARGYANVVRTLDMRDTAVERVASGRRPVRIPNLSATSDGRAAVDVPTEVVAPIIVARELFGLLTVGSPADSPIGEQDHASIVLIADRLAAALELAREREDALARVAQARREADARSVALSSDGIYQSSSLEPLLALAAVDRFGARQDVALVLVSAPPEQVDRVPLEAVIDAVRQAWPTGPVVRNGPGRVAIVLPAAGRDEAGDLARRIVESGAASHAGSHGPIQLHAGVAAADAGAVVSAAEGALALAARAGGVVVA